nr:PKD domain-containing protein [Candidatus Sigynarchaeota archaeon]
MFPQPDFYITNSLFIAGEEIKFRYNGTYGNGGSFYARYQWEFNDGSPPSNTREPTHIFSDPGDFSINLTVKDVDNDSISVIKTITIIPDLNPNAIINYTINGTTVDFLFTGTEGNGNLSFAWSIETFRTNYTSRNLSVSFRNSPYPRNYTATLTVTDIDGDSDSVSVTIQIPGTPRDTTPDYITSILITISAIILVIIAIIKVRGKKQVKRDKAINKVSDKWDKDYLDSE